ncbi:MAG: hypothetical protein F7C34_02070 [Desulfurococcales archaeon]|nr:hypothetical protein [Desulfurococcales archaeon]
MKRDDPRLIAARALMLTRRALLEVRKAKWRLKNSRETNPEILRSLYVIENVLFSVALRLQTISIVGILTPDLLRMPRELVKAVMREGVPLQLYPLIEELDATLSMLHVPEPPAGGEPLLAGNEGREDIGRKVKEILEEARREADRRLREDGLAQ